MILLKKNTCFASNIILDILCNYCLCLIVLILLLCVVNNKNQKLQYNQPLLKTPYPIDNVELSLVVPSYNEAKRLPPMIENTIRVINFF